MLYKIKKLLNELLFLTKLQRESLLSVLGKFHENELGEIFNAFSKLKGREENFIKDFFANNPDVISKSDAMVQSMEASLQPETKLSGEMQKLDKLSHKFKNISK